LETLPSLVAERPSVSVWVYVERPALRVLLLRRIASRAPGWQPVTGRVEPEDATLEAACEREIAEETGLVVPGRTIVDLGIEGTFVGYDGATYRQRSFAARVDAEAPPVVRPDEHEEARWASADEARARLRWDEDRAALAALERLVAARGVP
jgi:8-oxo-dGTP pyrophosphatase MutT (NUDIX family)